MKHSLGVAVVGLGRWGTNLVRALGQVPRARIVALSDLDARRLAVAVALAPDARLVSKLESVLENPDVEAVVLATPSAQHASHAARVLLSGRHVFVEKPMTTELRAANRLVELARARRLRLMVGHIMEHHPALGALLARVRNGELGSILRVETQRLGADPSATDAWWTLGPHDLSVLRLLLGSPEALKLRASHTRSAGVLVDRYVARLAYPRGVAASITVGFSAPHKTRRITVVGRRRTAVFDDTKPARLALFDPAGAGGDELPVLTPAEEPLVLEMDRFVRSILDGIDPGSDGRAGVEVVRLLEAGTRSLQSGREVRLVAERPVVPAPGGTTPFDSVTR